MIMNIKMFIESLSDTEKYILMKELNQNPPHKKPKPNVIAWADNKFFERKITRRLYNRIHEIFDSSCTLEYADAKFNEYQYNNINYRNLGEKSLQEYFLLRKNDNF